MSKPETMNRHRIDIGLGYASFHCEGAQSFIDQCLEVWYGELNKLYQTPRKMVEGDLYAGKIDKLLEKVRAE